MYIFYLSASLPVSLWMDQMALIGLQAAADYLADVCEISRVDVSVDVKLVSLCGSAMGVVLAYRYTDIERYHCCMAALRDFTAAMSAGGR